MFSKARTKEATEVEGILDSIQSDVNRCKNERKASTQSASPQDFKDIDEFMLYKRTKRKLIMAFIMCLIFLVLEVAGGVLANSLAIATDAGHLLTDLVGILISLFSLRRATVERRYGLNMGWHRTEIIGGFASVVLIWMITGILCYMAVQRMIQRVYFIDGSLMVMTAALGFVADFILVFCLYGHIGSRGHSLDSSAFDDDTDGLAINSNIRATLVHIIGSFCQSINVLVSALIIYFFPKWVIVDPICTILFSVLVFIVTFNKIKDLLDFLLEGKPSALDYFRVQNAITKIPGVIRVHKLRIWSSSSGRIALSAHLTIAKGQNPTNILSVAVSHINTKLSIYDLTLQIDEYRNDIIDSEERLNLKE